jgi:hypothetical protein
MYIAKYNLFINNNFINKFPAFLAENKIIYNEVFTA